jgi:hypothetical protein
MTEHMITRRTCLVLTTALSEEHWADNELAKAAKAIGLVLQRADDALQPNLSLLEAVLERIRRADVVVALVPEAHSPWLWLQVGAAIAFERPVVVVVTSPVTALPPELGDLFKVGPILSNQALTHALRRALKPTHREVRLLSNPTGIPLGGASEVFNAQLDSFGQGGQELPFSSWFAAVLDRARVPYDKAAPSNSFGVGPFDRIDFVVTANELDGNLGNPLPVELKARGSLEAFLRSRADAFASYLASTGATTLLLVALTGVKLPQLMPLAGGSLLACNARSLVDEMEDHTFGQAVIQLRNQAAHEGVRS